MGTVYLLHFSRPYRHARHYIGYAGAGLERRLEEHGTRSGANLLWYVAQAGITWELARTWENASQGRERALKSSGHTRRCPICRPELARYLERRDKRHARKRLHDGTVGRAD
jgi:predicted GIY-YIG superfamily endonuclease